MMALDESSRDHQSDYKSKSNSWQGISPKNTRPWDASPCEHESFYKILWQYPIAVEIFKHKRTQKK